MSSVWFYKLFSTCQVLLSALSWCSACTSVSEGVFLMCLWRDVLHVHILFLGLVLFSLNIIYHFSLVVFNILFLSLIFVRLCLSFFLLGLILSGTLCVSWTWLIVSFPRFRKFLAIIYSKEFRIMIVKMIQDLGKTMEKVQEMFTKDLEELKNKQTEANNALEGINSRITEQKNG